MPGRLIVLDCGLGDTLAFLSVLPTIKENNDDILVATHLPELFEGEKTVSVGQAKKATGKNLDDFDVYRWMDKKGWKGPLTEAFIQMNK